MFDHCIIANHIASFSLLPWKQAVKLKSREMKEGWMKNYEWWRMNDEEWMMKDDDFKLLRSFDSKQTDRWTCVNEEYLSQLKKKEKKQNTFSPPWFQNSLQLEILCKLSLQARLCRSLQGTNFLGHPVDSIHLFMLINCWQ